MPDLSDNCQVCGANPHESCGMSKMSHDAIDCPRNASAWDSRFDDGNELRPGEMPMTVFRLSGDEAFESAWSVVKEDDSKYAGTSKCPCRQGYNPCDDPKCNEWHKRNN